MKRLILAVLLITTSLTGQTSYGSCTPGQWGCPLISVGGNLKAGQADFLFGSMLVGTSPVLILVGKQPSTRFPGFHLNVEPTVILALKPFGVPNRPHAIAPTIYWPPAGTYYLQFVQYDATVAGNFCSSLGLKVIIQ